MAESGNRCHDRRVTVAQVKAVFLLPLADNDGRSLSAEVATAEAELYRLFGRWTRRGPVSGTYKMPDGSQALDHSYEYTILLEDFQLPELERVLKTFRAKTKQDAIYLELTPDVNVQNIQ
jgi:hypothetical protein